jgi:hypothetical protein
MSQNPYASPAATAVTAVQAPINDPALWNPGAAARWSLLFTPILGAILHAKNWTAIGDLQRARGQYIWVVANIVYVLLVIAASAVLPDSKALDPALRFTGLGMLAAWYFMGGNAQVAFVREHYGEHYPRRGWGLPLLIAVATVVVVVAVMIGALLVMDTDFNSIAEPR